MLEYASLCINLLAPVQLFPQCNFPRGKLPERKAVKIFMAPATQCLRGYFRLSIVSEHLVPAKHQEKIIQMDSQNNDSHL